MIRHEAGSVPLSARDALGGEQAGGHHARRGGGKDRAAAMLAAGGAMMMLLTAVAMRRLVVCHRMLMLLPELAQADGRGDSAQRQRDEHEEHHEDLERAAHATDPITATYYDHP